MTDLKKGKVRKTLRIIGNTLLWVFIAFSVAVTVMVFAAQGNENGVPELFGKSLITIVSPSMSPTYDAGDLVFMSTLDDAGKQALKAGDIITYKSPEDINGDGQIGDLNTHRILSIEGTTITTKGDNNDFPDNYTIGYNDIIGTSTEADKLAGVGNVIGFLRSSLGFFLCIVLPLILFFIYELYNFISLLVTERAKRVPVSQEAEEEIKRRAIEEYLAQQSAGQADDTAATAVSDTAVEE